MNYMMNMNISVWKKLVCFMSSFTCSFSALQRRTRFINIWNRKYIIWVNDIVLAYILSHYEARRDKTSQTGRRGGIKERENNKNEWRDSRDRWRKVWEESENRGKVRWRERHFWSLGMWNGLWMFEFLQVCLAEKQPASCQEKPGKKHKWETYRTHSILYICLNECKVDNNTVSVTLD